MPAADKGQAPEVGTDRRAVRGRLGEGTSPKADGYPQAACDALIFGFRSFFFLGGIKRY